MKNQIGFSLSGRNRAIRVYKVWITFGKCKFLSLYISKTSQPPTADELVDVTLIPGRILLLSGKVVLGKPRLFKKVIPLRGTCSSGVLIPKLHPETWQTGILLPDVRINSYPGSWALCPA